MKQNFPPNDSISQEWDSQIPQFLTVSKHADVASEMMVKFPGNIGQISNKISKISCIFYVSPYSVKQSFQ